MRARQALRTWLSLALLVTATAALSACSTQGDIGGGPPEPEAEGITLYSGRIPAAIGGAVDMYEAEVDRDIRVRFAGSADLAATLVEEGEGSPADVFYSDEVAALEALAERGLLVRLPDEILEQVPPEYRDEEGFWVGVTGKVRVIAYHESIPEARVPDSPLALTAPRFEGRVGWAPASGSLIDYVTALRLERGDAVARRWLSGMVANGVQEYPNNVAVRDAIAAGEIDLGLINHYYVAQAVAAEGEDYPVRVHFPPDGLGSLVLVTGVGVLAASDHRGWALGFVRSLLSDEAQRFFTGSSKEYPLASDVPPHPSLKVPLSEIPVPEGDFTAFDERQATVELMQATGAL